MIRILTYKIRRRKFISGTSFATTSLTRFLLLTPTYPQIFMNAHSLELPMASKGRR